MKRLGFSTIIFFIAVTMAAQVSVVAKIDSTVMHIGQQTNLTINVTAPKDAKIQFPEYKRSQEVTPGIEVISATNAETTDTNDSNIKVSKVLKLTSFDENAYSIPAIKIKVNGKDYSTNSLVLKIITVPVDTLHPDKFFPSKGVQDNPFLWSDWSNVFWLSALIVLLCVIMYWLFVRLHQNKPIHIHIRVIKRISPHQKAMTAIETIKTNEMQRSEDPKAYYTQLTDTIREYIEERFDFNAMEMTSTEIIARMETEGNQVMINELKELFETADLVKFAKHSTLINENDLNLVNAINFINETKIDGQATTEKIIPQLNDEEKQTKKVRGIFKLLIYIIDITVAILLTYIGYSIWQLLI